MLILTRLVLSPGKGALGVASSMALIPVIQAGDAQYLYGEVMNMGDVGSDEVSSLPWEGVGGRVQYLSMALIPVIQARDAQYLYGEVINTGDVDSDEVSSLPAGERRGVRYLSMALIPVIQAGDDQYLYGEVMNTGDDDSDLVSSLPGEGGWSSTSVCP